MRRSTILLLSQPLTDTLSRSVIEETPNNAVIFINGAQHPVILPVLQNAGYTGVVHAEGTRLLLAVLNLPIASPAPVVDTKPADAAAEVEAWNASTVPRVRAALEHVNPDVAQYLFTGLPSLRGPGAVFATAMILQRFDQLESGADRKSTRKSDHAALDALAERGITKEERKRVAALVVVAQTQPAVTLAPTPAIDPNAARTAAVTELYKWLRDWRETARVVIKNRTHLIHLGIGKRQSRKAVTPPPPAVATTPAAPPVAATPQASAASPSPTAAGPADGTRAA